MQILNNRLIMAEDEILMDCKRIETTIRGFLYSNNCKDTIVEVKFYPDQYNDETNRLWNDLVIHLIHPKGKESYIICTTDSYTPTLVNIAGEFKFYYVFEFGSETRTLLNGRLLEQMIWEHLKKTFDTASYTIKIS